MKALIVSLLFLCVVSVANAGEVSFSTGQRVMDAGGDDFTVGDWNYLQVTYKPDNSSFYYGLSHETAEVAPISYFAWTYSMTGLVAGIESNINKNISVFAEAGYYDISNNLPSSPPEGITYYFWYKFGDKPIFDQSTLENSNAFAGTVGIKFTQPITENLKIGFSASKRIIKIREVLRARFKQNNDWVWAVSTNRDYSSTSFGLNLNYSF